jgi:hypothetical protein
MDEGGSIAPGPVLWSVPSNVYDLRDRHVGVMTWGGRRQMEPERGDTGLGHLTSLVRFRRHAIDPMRIEAGLDVVS